MQPSNWHIGVFSLCVRACVCVCVRAFIYVQVAVVTVCLLWYFVFPCLAWYKHTG